MGAMRTVIVSLIVLICFSSSASTLIAEGDSITCYQAQGGGYAWLTVTNVNASIRPWMTNLAVGGDAFLQITNRAATVDGYYTNGVVSVVSVLTGANNLDGMNFTSVSNLWMSVKGYFLSRRSVGYKTVICTTLPRTNATFSTPRDQFNALIHSDTSWYDAIADFAADPIMGPDGANSNAIYYQASSPTHPSITGQLILEGIYSNAVAPLFGWHDPLIGYRATSVRVGTMRIP